jgi:uncharacterized damage-inducible protein DinB
MSIAETHERFDYLIETRSKFLDTFRSIGWEAFSRDRGATWGSMLGIFLHILDDEEGWLQYGVKRGSILDGPDRKIANYHDFDQLSIDNSQVGKLTRAYLASLSNGDLNKEISLKLNDGVYQRKVSKILDHAWVDELAHVGEWICLLWQLDVKPPYIDWLDYKL